MHSGRYQRLAEKSMEQSQCKHWLKGWRQIGGKAFQSGQKTTGNLPHRSEPDWRSMTVLLRPSHLGCRDRGLVVYQTHPFSFLRSCRSLPPSFDWKGSRKTQTRKEWQFEKLDSFSSIQPICKSTDFPVRDLIFLSTDNEGPAPVSAHENRRGHEEPADKVITFLIP